MVKIPITQTSSIAHLATDPLRNFKFQVTIRPNGGAAAVPLGFMSASGLNITVDVIAYRVGSYNTTALPVRTPVLTVNGWKPLNDLEPGDRVIDPMGEDSKVVAMMPTVKKDTYHVRLKDGSVSEACHGHLWTVEVHGTNNNVRTETVSTLELKALVESSVRKVYMPRIAPARFDAVHELPLDPYLLGILLAEGTFRKDDSITFASDDAEVVDRVRAALPSGHTLSSIGVKHRITIGNRGRANKDANLVLKAVRDLGLMGHRSWEKFIPEMYKFASYQDRLDLLRGIMDGDGSVDRNGRPSLCLTSRQLIDDVREVVGYLGGRCSVTGPKIPHYTYKGERREGRPAWWMFGFSEIEDNPFWLPRKARAYREVTQRSSLRHITSVEFARTTEVRCLEVSAPSHLFVHQGSDKTGHTSHNTQKMPGQADFSPITLSRGLAVGTPQNWQWMQQLFTVMQGTGSSTGTTDFRATVDIQVLSHPVTASTVNYAAWYRVYNAWPTALAYSDLDAGANQLLIEQMTLAHEGFDFDLAGGLGQDAATPPTETFPSGY